jgi:hypothetical protein
MQCSVTKFMDDNYLPNKFTDTEVGNVLLSLFSVLNITKEDMKSTIEKISSEISAQEGNDALRLLEDACQEFLKNKGSMR